MHAGDESLSEHRFEGFVLKQKELSSSRFILTLYTKNWGKRQGIYRVSKKEGRAYMTPLNKVLGQIFGKEHQELKKISELSLITSNYELGSNYLGLCLLQHWASLIDYSQAIDQPEETIYRLLSHCCDFMQKNAEIENIALYNLYFETWLLHLCGVLPRHLAPMELHDPQERLMSDLLNSPLIRRIFQVRIEQLGRDVLKLGSLDRTTEVLGKMWMSFLDRELKIRKILLSQIKERRSL